MHTKSAREEPVQYEPDDISGYDFTSVRPQKKTSVAKRSRRTPTPFSVGEIPEYLNSLSRGERKKAETAIRQYMEGPRKLSSLEALV